MTLRERVEKAVALLRQGFERQALVILERGLQEQDGSTVTTTPSGLELAFDPRSKPKSDTPEFSVGDSFINIKNEGWVIPEDVIEEIGVHFRDLFRQYKDNPDARELIHLDVHARLHELVNSGRIRPR